ncbi:hypothetical protein DFP73DRAFT_63848 [Morchella snyderi]|nr:hypothetical protein DFP73DRAFT_63848 [Morchella snyderi]
MSLCILYSIVSFFALVLDSTLVHAAPMTNPRNTTEPASTFFVPSPRGRGTLDIFFTCIITLVLCVWTAVHPNIVTDPSIIRCLKHRATYMVLGLLIPECVLGVAINEWRKARKVLIAWETSTAVEHAKGAASLAKKSLERIATPESDDESKSRERLESAVSVAEKAEDANAAQLAAKEVKEALKNYEAVGRIINAGKTSQVHKIFRRGIEAIRRSLPISDIFLRETPFGMEGAFFAVMGGYTFSPLDEYQKKSYRRTLSADTMVFLLENGVVDGEALASLKNEVKDKGKANVLAKFLVCAQALWMVMNCFLRRAAGLPITIIELNVIVHVFCAVVVYACWWKKPHDAGSPISLDHVIKKPIREVLFFMQYRNHLELHVSAPSPGDFSIATRLLIDQGGRTHQIHLSPDISRQNRKNEGKGKSEGSGENEKNQSNVTQDTVDGPLDPEPLLPTDVFNATTAEEELPHESNMVPEPHMDNNNAPSVPGIAPGVLLDLTGQASGQNIPQATAQRSVHPESLPRDVISPIPAGLEQLSTTMPRPPSVSRPNTASATQSRLDEIALYQETHDYTHEKHLSQVKLSADQEKEWKQGKPPLYPSHVFIDSGLGISLRERSGGWRHLNCNITAEEYQIFVSAAKALRPPGRPKNLSKVIRVNGDADYPILLKFSEGMKATQNSFNLMGLTHMWIPLYLIYGGIHSMLWNAYFPSPIERLLWRTSCLLIAFPGLGHFAILVATARVWKNFDKDTLPDTIEEFAPRYLIGVFLLAWAGAAVYGGVVGFWHVAGLAIQQHYRILIYVALETAAALAFTIAAWFFILVLRDRDWNISWGFKRYLRWALVIPMWLLLVAYFLARMFIFVETFICLRSLPIRAYETVIWEEILPHF